MPEEGEPELAPPRKSAKFWVNWQLWQKMGFVLAWLILVVLVFAFCVLIYNRKRAQRAAEEEEQSDEKHNQLEQTGTDDIPFGARALQTGCQVDGVWSCTPYPNQRPPTPMTAPPRLESPTYNGPTATTPGSPAVPNPPALPNTSASPGSPTIPSPAVPESPNMPDLPAVPGPPNVPGSPANPGSRESPGPGAPNMPGSPALPGPSNTPDSPTNPGPPTMPGSPIMPNSPSMPGSPAMPSSPGSLVMPNSPTTPASPTRFGLGTRFASLTMPDSPIMPNRRPSPPGLPSPSRFFSSPRFPSLSKFPSSKLPSPLMPGSPTSPTSVVSPATPVDIQSPNTSITRGNTLDTTMSNIQLPGAAYPLAFHHVNAPDPQHVRRYTPRVVSDNAPGQSDYGNMPRDFTQIQLAGRQIASEQDWNAPQGNSDFAFAQVQLPDGQIADDQDWYAPQDHYLSRVSTINRWPRGAINMEGAETSSLQPRRSSEEFRRVMSQIIRENMGDETESIRLNPSIPVEPSERSWYGV